MTTLRAALAAGSAWLTSEGIDGGPRDARVLLAEAIGVPVGRLSIEPDRDLLPDEIERYQMFLDRRSCNEPVARILSRRKFWGREFCVASETLDPRPETETLIAAALELGPVTRFADLGTGTGIIAVTLLAEWPEATALAIDIDLACLSVAAANAARHGVAERLDCATSDWFGDVVGRFALIVSNPPYIAAHEMAALAPDVTRHDPHHALTDGADGLTAYRHITMAAPHHLEPGGTVMVEIGPTQGTAVSRLFRAAGLINLRILPDLDRRDRVVMAQMPE
jgi:release factor glutamine methyltransferase